MKARLLLIVFLIVPVSFCIAQRESCLVQANKKVNAGEYASAIELIENVERFSFDSVIDLLSLKAFCYYRLAKHDKALGELSYMEENGIEDILGQTLYAFYLCRDNEIDAFAENILYTMEQDAVQYLSVLGRLERKDLSAMSAAMKKYIETTFTEEEEDKADKAPYKTILAMMYFVQGNNRECYNNLSVAIEDYPLALSSFLMGKIKMEQKEYLSAISYFTQSITQGYKALTAYELRAISKGFENDFYGSIEDLSHCIDKDNNHRYYYLRAISYNYVMQYEKALDDLEHAISLCDTIAEYFNQTGIVYSNLKDYSAAVTNFQTALKINPELKFAHNNLALVLEKIGMKQEALKNYRMEIEVNPEYEDPYFNLGRISLDERNYKQAVKYLKKAYELNTRLNQTQYLLGVAYLKRGKTEEACYYFSLAAEDNYSQAVEAQKTYCGKSETDSQ